MRKTQGTGAPFAPTHTLLAGWGYDDLQAGFPRFYRAAADTPVRVDEKANAKPGHVIAYNEAGERLHITKRALRQVPGTETPGQLAYERDRAKTPNYHDGRPRPAWEWLEAVARQSWERNPTDR